MPNKNQYQKSLFLLFVENFIEVWDNNLHLSTFIQHFCLQCHHILSKQKHSLNSDHEAIWKNIFAKRTFGGSKSPKGTSCKHEARLTMQQVGGKQGRSATVTWIPAHCDDRLPVTSSHDYEPTQPTLYQWPPEPAPAGDCPRPRANEYNVGMKESVIFYCAPKFYLPKAPNPPSEDSVSSSYNHKPT